MSVDDDDTRSKIETYIRKRYRLYSKYYKNHERTQMKSSKRFDNSLLLFRVRFIAKSELI